jgi:sugar phosphate isomerase/epimerase
MKVGCCAPVKYLDKLKMLGFDFIECSSMDLPSENNGFITHVNKFIPSDKSIFSDDDYESILNFITHIISTASTLKIKSITLGSGSSRRISNSVISNIEKGKWERLLLHIDQLASKQSVLILLEPLTKMESNFINTIKEAVEWIEILNLHNFGITIDSYHYLKEHSSLDQAYINQKYIKHAHFANFNQNVPQALDNDLIEFIKFIKRIGCDLSIEMVPFCINSLNPNILNQIKEV